MSGCATGRVRRRSSSASPRSSAGARRRGGRPRAWQLDRLAVVERLESRQLVARWPRRGPRARAERACAGPRPCRSTAVVEGLARGANGARRRPRRRRGRPRRWPARWRGRASRRCARRLRRDARRRSAAGAVPRRTSEPSRRGRRAGRGGPHGREVSRRSAARPRQARRAPAAPCRRPAPHGVRPARR